jgi:hypothetical protein
LAQSVATEYEQELSLLGLWHRHPGSMDTFSGTDDGTNRTFARLNSKGAISGLVNIDPYFRFTLYHVANPLHYEIVEVEVGDDFIPEEYFKLKHYPSKGLNPPPPENNTAEHIYKNRYNTDKTKNENLLSMIYNCMNTKYLFLLIFIAGLFFTVFMAFSYQKLKGTADIKALYKIIYSDKDNNFVVVPDSITNLAEKEFDGKVPDLRKRIDYKELFISQLSENEKAKGDSLFAKDEGQCKAFIDERLKVDSIKQTDAQYDDIVDSLKNVYQKTLIDKELKAQKIQFVETQKEAFLNAHTPEELTSIEAQSKSKKAILALLVLSVISILVAFVPKQNKRVKEWVVVGFAFLATLGISFFNPFNLLSIAYLIFIFGAFSLFCLIAFIAVFVLETFYFQKDIRYWFQRNKILYVNEDREIKNRFPEAEKNVENGIVSFLISTDKKINNQSESLAFQLVYPADYIKDKGIKVYFVNPDIDDLFENDIQQFPYVEIDRAGEKFLNLAQTIPAKRVSGIGICSQLFKWLQMYNKWKADEININDIKL